MPSTPEGTGSAPGRAPSEAPNEVPKRDARGRFVKQSIAREIAASEAALESTQHELESARFELESARFDLEGARTALAERERELEALRGELGALRTEFAGLRADSARVAEGRLSLQTLQVDLASRDRRVADLEDQLLESRHRIAALEQRPAQDDGPSAEALERSVDLVRQTLKESLKSLRDREEQASGLETRLATTERMLDERVRELDATRAQLANARETIVMREEEIVILRGSASRAQKSVATRDSELATANERLEELRQDLAARDDQVSRLRDGQTAAERAASLAESEVDALRKRLEAHGADAERHAEEQRRSQDALAAVKESLEARDQEITALRRIQSVAEGRLGDQELEVQELEARLEAEGQAAAKYRRDAAEAAEHQEELDQRLSESERDRQRLATSLASVQRIIAEAGAPTAGADTSAEAPADASNLSTDETARNESIEAAALEAAEGWTSVRTETPGIDESPGLDETPETTQALAGWSQPAAGPGTEASSPGTEASSPWHEASSESREPDPGSDTVAPLTAEAEASISEDDVAELLPPSTADTYWEGRHLSDKLANFGASDRVSFFARHIERACQEGDRTVRVLSVGGVPHFEVRLARRLVDGGCKQFKIRLLVGSEAAAAREKTAAEAEGVAGNLELLVGSSPQGEARHEPKFDVVFVPGDIARLSRIEERIEAWKRWLSPEGVCVVASSIGEAGGRRGEAATTVAQRIFEVMPGRYKHDHVSGGPKTDLGTAFDAGSSDGSIRAATVLPALVASGFAFETFVAFGGVGDLFFGPSFGPNFDPTQASDRRFVDRLVRLDDDKIEAGVLKPVRMLAALRNEPVANPTIPNGWTPEFCLTPARGVAATRSDQASDSSAASTISLNES